MLTGESGFFQLKRLVRYAVIAAIFLGLALSAFCQVVPATNMKALNETPVVFPKEGSTKPLLLMLGFSHKSGNDFQNWNKLFKSPYLTDSRIDYFELVDLQGVPSFVKDDFTRYAASSFKSRTASFCAILQPGTRMEARRRICRT